MRDKTVVLGRLVAVCNELEVLPGDAAQWILTDLVDGNVLDSMTLLQLAALIEEEFGVVVSHEEFVAQGRTLDALAARIASRA